jgi:hypothetical protein
MHLASKLVGNVFDLSRIGRQIDADTQASPSGSMRLPRGSVNSIDDVLVIRAKSETERHPDPHSTFTQNAERLYLRCLRAATVNSTKLWAILT